MRGSHAKTAPQALSDWLAKETADWTPSYSFPADVREPVVKALAAAQRGLCVYCGRKLDRSSPGRSYHIEHFRPQGLYPDLATSLANLFLSCGQEDATGNRSRICGTAKDGWFDECLVVEPDYPACTDRFRFSLTGDVVAEDEEDVAAEKMIQVLNLNHAELRRERKEILYHLDGLGDDELGLADFVDMEHERVESYAHMVCQRLGCQIP